MNPYSLVPLAACLIAAAVAGAVLARGPGEKCNRLMAAMLAASAHWALCEAIWNNLEDPVWVLRTIRISGFGWLALGPVVLHLVLEVEGDERSWARQALPTAYALAGASALLYLTSSLCLVEAVRTEWGWSYTLGPLFPVVCAPAVFWAVLGILRWRRMTRRESTELERRQTRRALGALGFTLVAALVTDVLLPALSIPGPRLGSASVVVFCGFVAQGVARNDYFVLAPGVFAERILRSLRDGAAMVRASGRLAFGNPALARMAGLEPEQLGSISLGELLPDLALPAAGELRDVETELRTTTGRRIPVAVSSAAVRDKADNPIGRVFAIRDLRDVVAMRDRIVTTGRLAAVGELAAAVVHEVSSPIAFMRTNLAELRRLWRRLEAPLRGRRPVGRWDALLEEGGEILGDSVEGIERIAGLVDSVRSFSHAGLGERELADVNLLLEGAVRMAEPKLRRHGARLHKSYSSVPPVLCSTQELRQLFLNLLLNAANAVEEGGTIRIRSEESGGAAVVRVRDDGRGMDRETLEGLFDPVFAPGVSGGLGIGLPACYEIVRKHGGSLEVESEEGRGTVFRIELPAAPE